MTPIQQFEMLGKRQLAIQEGISMLEEIQRDFKCDRVSADAWGRAALLANVALIPLNCIVNAFELGAAKSAYEAAARWLYEHYAKSGTRIGGRAKTALWVLKLVIATELKRKGLTQFIPGANILIGLAEDSVTAFQTAAMVESGAREGAGIARQVAHIVAAQRHELMRLGILRAESLKQVDRLMRTASAAGPGAVGRTQG